jgi:hypothetical protein
MIQSFDIPTIRPNNLEKIMNVASNPVDFNSVVTGLKTHKYFRPISFKVDTRNGNVITYCPFRRKRKKKNIETSCSFCEKELPPVVLSNKLSDDEYCSVIEARWGFFNPDISWDIIPKDFEGELMGINFLLVPSTKHCDIQDISPEEHAISYMQIGVMEKMIAEVGYPWVFVGKNMGHSPTFRPLHSQYHIAGINLTQLFDKKIIKEKERRVELLSQLLDEAVVEKKEARVELLSQLLDEAVEGKKELVRPDLFPGDIKFLKNNKCSYSQYTKDNYQKNLPYNIIRDYGEMVVAIHPDMKRPLEMIIYPKDSSIEKVQDLNDKQRIALARATSDISYSLSTLMPAMDMDEDYCFVFHNASGTFYVEAYPWSQSVGCFERARIYPCDSSPAHSGDILKEYYHNHVPIDWLDREPRSKEFVEHIQKTIVEPIDNKHIREYEDKVM